MRDMLVSPLGVTVEDSDGFLPSQEPPVKLGIVDEGAEEARVEAADYDAIGDRGRVDAEGPLHSCCR